MPTIRVILVEDNALLREGISHMIEVDEELDLVGVDNRGQPSSPFPRLTSMGTRR